MVYPPELPPVDQNDGIDSDTGVHDGVNFGLGHHAEALHNRTGRALADIIAELGNDPSGAFANVQARLAALDTPEAWHVVGATGEPAFNAPWRAFAGQQVPRFRKVGKLVYLDGTLGHDGAANASTAFVLPLGYRPAGNIIPYGFNRLDVLTDGSVVCRGVGAGSFHAMTSSFWID